MSILITGGTGFLGRHVVSALAARYPGEELRVLTRARPESAPLDLDPDRAPCAPDPATPAAPPPPSAVPIEGDVLDPASLARAVLGCRAAVHLAGRVAWGERAGELFALHVGGTRNVIEAARTAGCARIVYASTSGTVGLSERLDAVADEQSPYAFELARRWPYYHSKLLAERVAMDAALGGAPVVIVSPSLLLGPGDARESSSALVTRYLRRQILAVPPGVAAVVDVRDAADAFVAALERGAPGVRYLLGQNASFAELFAMLENASGLLRPWLEVPRGASGFFGRAARALERVERALGQSGERGAELEMAGLSWAISCERARADLGFAPRPLEETLTDAVRWFQARGGVADGEALARR